MIARKLRHKPGIRGVLLVASGIAALSVLVACETTDFAVEGDGGDGVSTSEVTGEAENRISWGMYTPFYDQGDHLKSLVTEDREFDNAAKLYLEQKEYFTANRDKHRETLNRLAEALNETENPPLQKAIRRLNAIKWPAPVGEWSGIQKTIISAESTLESYPSHDMLKEEEFRSPKAKRLNRVLKALKRDIRNDAKTQFTLYDHFGEGSFFAIYPELLAPVAFMERHYLAIAPKLDAAETKDLKVFAANYDKSIVGEKRWERLGDTFIAAHLREGGKSNEPDLVDVLGAVRAAKAAGFEPKKVPGLKIGFIEVTSKTLLKHGQIEFPATVDVDLPVEAAKAELDDALTNPTAQSADYLIIFDVALAKAKRRVTGVKKIPSKLLVGHKTEPNPEYNMVQNEVNNARLKVQQAAMRKASVDAQYCQGIGCLGKAIGQIAAGVAQGSAQRELEETMAKLGYTPMTLEKPVYRKYNYQKASVKASKLMTVHYYVIDRRKNTYFKSTFDVSEIKAFEVAYQIHEDDQDKSSHLSSADTEEDVVEWEEAASSIKLSQLIDHYVANAGQSQKLPSLTALRKEMLEDKNMALAKYEANTFSARPLNDPRFDSVVVIYTGEGSLGSGFFVKPDTVLTNWHVVEDKKFVELKMYDGQETFGKTMVTDVRLDLALIKVQRRGNPVQLYTGKTLDLGATVEAIGHPKGLEFSITRGVISALRSDESFASIRTVGGDAVLLIQTDAPINKGNSGGPLFLGDKVIGVNSQGFKKNLSEGLNFAIHYSEVLNFLKENLPGFVVRAR